MTVICESGANCTYDCVESNKNEYCPDGPYHEIVDNYYPEIFLKNNPEITFGNYDISTWFSYFLWKFAKFVTFFTFLAKIMSF